MGLTVSLDLAFDRISIGGVRNLDEWGLGQPGLEGFVTEGFRLGIWGFGFRL